MALSSAAAAAAAAAAAFFLVVLLQAHLSSGLLVKGSVSCMDCTHLPHDLSGLRVAVRCRGDKRPVYASTDDKGYFQVEAPSTIAAASSSSADSCLAMLLGGPEQLCSSKKSLVSALVKSNDTGSSYTVSTPLTFFSSCKQKGVGSGSGSASAGIGSAKTVNLPLPPEWGLPPTSYYAFPFIPIIGIP